MDAKKITLEDSPALLLTIINQLDRIEAKFNSIGTPNAEVEKPINVHAAANFTDREVASIYNLVAAKKIPFHKDGSKLYFFKSELSEFIRSGGRRSLQTLKMEV